MAQRKNDVRRRHLGIGIVLGVAIGAGLGVALGNLVLGIGPSIAVGVALGLITGNKHAKTTQQSSHKNGDCDA